jgi:hypothetical protein
MDSKNQRKETPPEQLVKERPHSHKYVIGSPTHTRVKTTIDTYLSPAFHDGYRPSSSGKMYDAIIHQKPQKKVKKTIAKTVAN